ncbi:MAG: zinc ABC transporter substrate-binding protein [Phycisphaerae bacterium]|nr:zinc ABC transporter substrate-binding protein [Phycisphaerae bacterium]
MRSFTAKRMVGLSAAIAPLILASCDRTPPSTRPTDATLAVYVSIPPQKYFVRRIGGDHVNVSVLLAPGQSPHTYEPTPKEMVRLSQARAFFRVGLPFEKHVVEKIAQAMKNLTIVDTRKGIELLAAAEHEHDDDAHPDHAHHHPEQDPHTWMNPRLAKVQADTIRDALCEIDPANAPTYRGNCSALLAELDAADAKIAKALAPLRGKEFYVFHPAFGYFAQAYGLKQVAIESGGKQPTAKQLTNLIDRAKAAGVKLIFVQPQFDRRNAETVAHAIGGAVVPLDPLAEDYVQNLLHVAATVQKTLSVDVKGEAQR